MVKNIAQLSLLILLFFSNILSSQSYGSLKSHNDIEKLLSWIQVFAYQEEDIAITYKSASIRNGILEINDLIVASYVYPSNADFDKINSINALLTAGSYASDEEFFKVKKIQINIGYLDKLINFSRSRDIDMLKEFYKSETYVMFDEVIVSPDLAITAANEVTTDNAFMINKVASYLDTFSFEIGAKTKGKLRSNVMMNLEFGNDLSFNYSMVSSVDENALDGRQGNQYFNVLADSMAPIEYIANALNSFLVATTRDCGNLYSKDNLQAWTSTLDGEYCLIGLEYLDNIFSDSQLNDSFDVLTQDFDTDLLYLNQLNTQIYEAIVNIAWSEQLFKDISLLSGGVIDAGLFTMKSLLSEKLTKSEFEQTLGFFLMDPEVSAIASSFSFDELYKVYSDYYFKLKSFANKPKGIGVSVKSKDGLDTEYLLYLAENPFLMMGLLNSVEVELLLNKRN